MHEHQTFLRRSFELARIARERGNDPFGAVLVHNGEPVFDTHDRSVEESDPTCHAELWVISRYCREHRIFTLPGFTLYSSTEPCVMCSGAIHWARISRIVYGVSQHSLHSLSGGSPKLPSNTILNSGKTKVEIIGPLLEEEGLEVFAGYRFVNKR